MANHDEHNGTSLYEALDYFHTDEQQTKQGLSTVAEVLNDLPRDVQRELFDGEDFKAVLQVGMGTKPAVALTSHIENFAAEISVRFPDQFLVVSDLLINRQAVTNLITRNDNHLFDDAQTYLHDDLLDSFLENISTSNEDTSLRVAQVGLILGYPPESVVAYAKHKDGRKQCLDIILNNDDVPAVLRRSIQSASNNAGEMEEVGTYKLAHREEILAAFAAHPAFDGISDEDRMYFTTALPTACPGFNFEATPEEHAVYKKNIMAVWELSGAQELYTQYEKDVTFINPNLQEDISYFELNLSQNVYREFEKILVPRIPELNFNGSRAPVQEGLVASLGDYFSATRSVRPTMSAEITTFEEKITGTLDEMINRVKMGFETSAALQHTELSKPPSELVDIFSPASAYTLDDMTTDRFLELNRGYYVTERLVDALKVTTTDQEEVRVIDDTLDKYIHAEFDLATEQKDPQEVFKNICADLYSYYLDKRA